MNEQDYPALQASIREMMAIARRHGLDFFDMRFEIVPADVLYTFGAYQGMPTHFAHWSFGKQYHRMKLDYDLGLSRIYELVINSDPCYAFLLDSNSLVQNKLVSAHVLAHCDFFKHNAHFSRTARNVVDSMAASAERFRAYELQYGSAAVEETLDAALALQEHIDPSLFRREGDRQAVEARRQPTAAPKTPGPYDDLFACDPRAQAGSTARAAEPAPEKDVLRFILLHSRMLEDWQRDILTVVRDEMLYFWPQIETKIMNEGWATYWHLRIMRELDLTDDEAFDFARTHAGVVVPSRMSINPYLLGLKLWEDIERRLGREAMFEIREMDADSSFIRNYLTEDIVRDLDLYLYQKVGSEWRVVEKDWEKVRDKICASRVNGGYPVICVKDGDHLQAGELYLRHSYEGVELDVKYTEKTLPYVHRLWGRTVHLETVLEGRPVLFTCDGKKVSRRFL